MSDDDPLTKITAAIDAELAKLPLKEERDRRLNAAIIWRAYDGMFLDEGTIERNERRLEEIERLLREGDPHHCEKGAGE